MLRKAALFILCAILTFLFITIIPVGAASRDVTEYDAATVMNIMNNTSLTNLKAKAAILVDHSTGKVLLEKQP